MASCTLWGQTLVDMRVQVSDIAIRVQNASSIIDHLRYMPKEQIAYKLESLDVERQKFSFQPFITGPYSAVNIIVTNMCNLSSLPA